MLKTLHLISILLRFKDEVLIVAKKAQWDLASHHLCDLVSKIITLTPFQSHWSPCLTCSCSDYLHCFPLLRMLIYQREQIRLHREHRIGADVFEGNIKFG